MTCAQLLTVKVSWTQDGNVMIAGLMPFIMHLTNKKKPTPVVDRLCSMSIDKANENL